MIHFRWFVGIVLALVGAPIIVAQPYVSKQYSATAESDVVYATAPAFNGRIDTLRMNVWTPVNDGPGLRPCVVWVHGGGFTSGNRVDMNAACADWAARGYVAVTISYRLGFYGPFPLDPPFAYDQSEVVRACFRGVQDLGSAMRHLVNRAAAYRIDTSRFILGGASAGAIIALHGAYLDSGDSLPRTLGQIAPVQRGFDVFPRPDLGPLTPLPRIRAVVNIFGALTDLNILKGAELPATWSYHQRADPVVPCDTRRALWGLPLGVGDNYPVLHGSCTLDNTFAQQGLARDRYQTIIYEGADHDLHDRVGLDRSAAEFCARWIGSTVSVAETTEGASTSGPWTVVDLRGTPLRLVDSLDNNLQVPDGVYVLMSATARRMCIVRDGRAEFFSGS